MEQRDAVLKGGFQFFDKNLVVLKAWDPDMDLQKEEIQKLQIWV